ncbi:MAG: cytochrome c biogenesis CcdA family protein [Gaiellales bacterium]
MDLGLFSAFVGGVLMLLSPCSAMLLPAFFSYAFSDPKQILGRTGVFYLGLITTLVPMGILAGSFGALVNEHRGGFVAAASVIVIVMGALLLFAVPIPGVSRTARTDAVSTASVYVLGTVYGLAGVCAGPLLGAVLAIAALSGSPLYGGVALLVFAAGMTVPLVVLALAWQRFPAARRLVRPRELRIGAWRNTWSNVIGGLLTIGVGVLLLVTQGTASLGGILGASTQFGIESEAMRVTGAIPNVVFYAAAMLAVGAWLLVRRRRGASLGPSDADEESTPS